jgi:hypothetical protein
MPESKNNTRGQGDAPKTFLDDYLPDSSPRPKYVIATIYPPSNEPLVIPEGKCASEGEGGSVPVQATHETVLRVSDAVLPAHHDHGIIDTGGKESSLGITSPRAAGAGSGSGETEIRSPVAIGPVGHPAKSSSLVTEPSVKEGIPLMELPRGRFRSLERNASLISLLHHLHLHAFRGSCRINRNGSTILLVFNKGKIILAEYDDLAGDAALDMICNHRFARVEAIISDLDEAQIRLSLEFNPSWKVQSDQEPFCIVSPELLPNTGRKQSLTEGSAPEPEPEKYLKTDSGSEFRSVQPGFNLPGAPDESPAAEDATPAISVNNGEEPDPREEVGLSVPDGTDTADWRKALAIPLPSSRGEPVPSIQPEQAIRQVPEEKVYGRDAHTTSTVSQGPGEIVLKSHEERCPEDPGNVEGWKKALYIPVIPILPEEKPSVEQATGVSSRLSAIIPDFEPLSADSGLFDDIPVGKRIPRAPAPEPAEQWKSMGMNRGENSSV